MTAFTRREKHVLVVFALTLLAILLFHIEQQTINDYELLWLLLYVLPLGAYIATDPERKI
jgi:hypothetical protein